MRKGETDIVTTEEARERLAALQKKQSAFYHALGLMSYDGETTAPKGTAANRAQSTGVLSEELYRLSTGEETIELLEYLDGEKDSLDEKENREVYLLLREVLKLRKIPMDEYVAHEKLLVEAQDVWHTSKLTDDWPLFEPYMERIVTDAKRFAAYCAPEKQTYDYWLSEFEEGLDRGKCDAFFAVLRERIVPLLRRVQEKPRPDRSILTGHFPVEAQKRFSLRLMELIGLDLSHVGLAETEHPFTTSLGSHLDERITTHYHEDDFSSSMYSVIHEGGHALYDTGSSDDLAYTALDGGVSMAIHESQSRFYENILGRSRAFCECIFPELETFFPGVTASRTPDELYSAVCLAEPSLIRTEADELTYALHVMVRYELEKRLMDGSLEVKELPEAWNALYKDYLGIDVPDNRRGVLQDSHWSGGAIGYFPSYALGSAYGAQLLRKMHETVDVDAALRAGNFAPVNDWLRERVWRHGCLYAPAELFKKAVGEDFDPTAFTDYLTAKYTDLYGL